MSKPTAAQIARFRAIAAKKKPANDDAPAAKTKGTLRPVDFVGTVLVNELKIADDVRGNIYMTLPGAEVIREDGSTLTRTVMVFEAYDIVTKVIQSHQDIVAMLRHTGGTLKIIGVMVDGEMVMVDMPTAQAV